MTQPASFLLLSCSQRKRAAPGLLPAIERYNGPQFQVVRKFTRTHPDARSALDIAILSARFGVISPSECIPHYDQRVTPEQAARIRPSVIPAIRRYFEHTRYQRCCISLSQDYLEIIAGIEGIIPPTCEITYIRGSQGERLSQLFDWLYADQPCLTGRQIVSSGHARLRGVNIHLKPEEVLACGRRALAWQMMAPPEPKAWYVEIDGHQVGPKWLVSQISGLSVQTFNTTDARRVLKALGVEVHRT